MILGATYTANLASFFVLTSSVNPGLTSIDDANSKRATICTPLNSVIYTYLQAQYPNIKLVPPLDNLEINCFQSLLTGEADGYVTPAYIFDMLSSKAVNNPLCNIIVVGGQITYYGAGFSIVSDNAPFTFSGSRATRCSSAVIDAINIGILRKQNTNALATMWANELNALNDLKCPAHTALSPSMDVADMAGIWIIYASFVAGAIIIWIGESMQNIYLQRTKFCSLTTHLII
jgi:hypothetical protein